MKTTRTIGDITVSDTTGLIGWLPGCLRNRRTIMIIGLSLLGLGMTLNWGWLTAVGAAPILLSLAPCAVMCAVGIYCMKGNKKHESSDLEKSDDTDAS